MTPQLLQEKNPGTVVLDSLLEHPEDWEFDKGLDAKYIHHKSKFELSLHGAPKVWSPDWAKGFVFSLEDQKMIMKVIRSLQEERNNAAKKDLSNKIVKLLESKEIKTILNEAVTAKGRLTAILFAVLACSAAILLFRVMVSYG